jgi:hypothetical protein
VIKAVNDEMALSGSLLFNSSIMDTIYGDRVKNLIASKNDGDLNAAVV